VNGHTVVVIAALLTAGCAGGKPVRTAESTPNATPSADAVLEGTLELLIEDAPPASRIVYYLIAEGRRVTLRISRPSGDLVTGDRVRVRGVWNTDRTEVTVDSIERR
jgi:hypothetical protein